MKEQGANISINQMYELMMKLDERLDQVQTDLAVIKEKQSIEIQRLQLDVARIEAEQQELRTEVKQIHERLANRDRTLVGILLTAGLGFLVWFIQETIKK